MALDLPDGTKRIIITTVIVSGVPEVPAAATEQAAGAIGRYSGTGTTYQTVASWTVAAGKVGELKEIILVSDNFPVTKFQVTVGAVVYCTEKILRTAMPLVFGDLKLAAGVVVLIEAKSTDGTSITVDGIITAKELG